ncbi:MAG: DUF4330 domain-containing protein [Oscillospiraceae bacterium]|nr:DUF4330 domain-containing protein [Oscillospiraceae bacterium]
MKLFDEKGRLFGKISVIDVIVVVLVIVLAVAVSSRFVNKQVTTYTDTSVPFTFQVCFRGMRQVSVDQLQVGDRLYERETGTYLGKIASVEVKPNLRELTGQNGEYIIREAPDRFDAVVTLESEGFISGSRYFASGSYELCANAPLSCYSKYLSLSGTIWDAPGAAK